MAVHAEIQNGTTLKRIETTRFKGGEYLDLRAYYEPDKGSGEWRPTKKGITFRPDELPQLAAAVAAAIAEYQ